MIRISSHDYIEKLVPFIEALLPLLLSHEGTTPLPLCVPPFMYFQTGSKDAMLNQKSALHAFSQQQYLIIK